MADEAPSLEQLVHSIGGQVAQIAQGQAAQARTLQQLMAGNQQAAAAAQAAARAAQPAPNPDAYSKLNEKYLETFANDPVGLRNAERQQMAQEIAASLRQEMAQNISAAERQRHAEEMERSIYQQHPHLVSEGPYLEFYLNHLNRSPGSAQWPIDAKVTQAIQWAYENKAEREKQIIDSHERTKREQARASTPGGGFHRDPGGAGGEEPISADEANKQRFEVLQGRKAAAMAGGRYAK